MKQGWGETGRPGECFSGEASALLMWDAEAVGLAWELRGAETSSHVSSPASLSPSAGLTGGTATSLLTETREGRLLITLPRISWTVPKTS